MDKDTSERFEAFFMLEYDNLLKLISFHQIKYLAEWKKLTPFDKINIAGEFIDLMKKFIYDKNDYDKIFKNLGLGFLGHKVFINEATEEFETESKYIILKNLKELTSKSEKIKYLDTYRNDYVELQVKYDFEDAFIKEKSLNTFINQQLEKVSHFPDDNSKVSNEKNKPEDLHFFTWKQDSQKIIELHEKLVADDFIKRNIRAFKKIFSGEIIKSNLNIQWIKKSVRLKTTSKIAIVDLFFILSEYHFIDKRDIFKSSNQVKHSFFNKISKCFIDDKNKLIKIKSHNKPKKHSEYYSVLKSMISSL